MAELIYLCGRGSETAIYTDRDLERVASRICPENAPLQTEVTREDGILYCLINPPECLPVRDRSVCLGLLIPPRDD